MRQHQSRALRMESLESRLVLSATFQDAGIDQQAIDAINNSQYASTILGDETLHNVLDAIAGSRTAPAGATLITSEAQFSLITSGTVQNPNEYLVQGDLTVTGTFEVPSNVHIYVDGSIYKQGSYIPPGNVHSGENYTDAIFRLSNADNVKLIGIDNALLHSNPNLNVSSPHTSAIIIRADSDNVEVDGFEIANVWEGIVAHANGGGTVNDTLITNNYIRNTVGRAIWSLQTKDLYAVHNFIENAGMDGLDWDAFTDSATGYENVVIGAGRWAGFVEEAAHDSYFIRGLSLIVDHNNPNRGFMLGWADNGTTLNVFQNSGQQTRDNFFIDNVVFDPENIPNSSGDYFAKSNTGGKGLTYFWANRGYGAGQSSNNFDNAEWLEYLPTAGGPGNSIDAVQLLADLDALYNPPPLTPGDFNSDGYVDNTDLAQWEGDFGINGGSDADGDGLTTGFDFLAWQRNFSPAPSVNETVITVVDADYTSAEGYSSGNLAFQQGWLGQTIAQLDTSGTGTVSSIGGPWDRNAYGDGATGGAGGIPSSTGFDDQDKLRITFDYQFNLSGNVNTNMANVGIRNEGPNAGNGWDAKPLEGFQMRFNTSQPTSGGTVKIFPDMNDTNDADALLLTGLQLGIDPASGDLVSDNLQIVYEASTDGAGNWSVDSVEIENLTTSTTFVYAGPIQSFSYAATDAFFAQQLAPNGDSGFSGVTDGVRFEYIYQGATLAVVGETVSELALSLETTEQEGTNFAIPSAIQLDEIVVQQREGSKEEIELSLSTPVLTANASELAALDLDLEAFPVVSMPAAPGVSNDYSGEQEEVDSSEKITVGLLEFATPASGFRTAPDLAINGDQQSNDLKDNLAVDLALEEFDNLLISPISFSLQ